MTTLSVLFARTPTLRRASVQACVALTATIFACSSAPSSPDTGGAGAGSPGNAGAGVGGASAGSAGAPISMGGAQAGASTGGTAGVSAAGSAGQSGGGEGGLTSGGSSGAAGSGGMAISHAADAAFCSTALDSAAADFKGFLTTYTDPKKVPRSYTSSATPKLLSVDYHDWTSGFIAGELWFLYEHTQDAAYLKAAQTWTTALSAASTLTTTHDVGFIIMSSYGNGYRLTKNPDYAPVIKTAGASLATRFNAKVGCTKSWDAAMYAPFPVIIDNMMNLELLYRATELGGSPTFAADAVSHAMTTKTNHFRPDFSSYHLVNYDPTTGAVLKKQTVQGISDDSAWARGQTWGLYGFTVGWRESKTQAFLDQAIAIAEFYTKHADFPADNVPYFDFSVLTHPEIMKYRDTSAAAVAASGLLELANYVSPEAAERYRAFAIKALRSLAAAPYRAAAGSNGNFLLTQSVGNFPAGGEINASINYADYYYLEALNRCAALK